MKSNKEFKYNTDLEQELNNDLKIYKNNTEYLKTDNSNNVIDINKPIQHRLMEFISNTNKFNFSSAFDRKGAKSFLKSKGEALQKIDLNEYILDENERKVEVNKKDGETRKKNVSCKGFNKKIRKELKDNMISYKQKVKSMKSINQFKKKVFENQEKIKKKSKHKHKDKIRSSKNNTCFLTEFLNKEINIDNKKSKKFMSQMELKMISDKDVSKLKPIKKNNYTLNNNPIINNSFIRSDSSKTNSTLFHLVSAINKV